MNEIEAVTYAESREAFFAGALRKAERQLDWAVKHNPDCYVCAEKGEAVAYYQDALAALREKADFVRCKHCEYWQDNNGGYPHEECRWGHDETPDADDFCSYGKRLEVEP